MTSDGDYLIGRAVSCLKTDPASAKSWMLFAKSVFPHSFPVQFQAYKMECDQKNFNESALYLTELMKKFSNEAALIKEQKSIASALACEENSFLKQLFSQLSDDTKYDLMIAVTRNVKSVKEHCELMLLFLKRMPNARLLQHGGSIVDTLLSAEESLSVNTPINLFRKMLVCDALPLILKIGQFEYKSKIVFQLLQKSIEFYASSIFAPAENNESSKKEMISSDQSSDEVWKPLLKLIETVAVRYRWSYPELFVSNFNELSLHQLLLLSKRRNKLISSLINENRRPEESSGYEEAYIYLTAIYFYYLHQFGKMVRPKIFSGEVTGPYNFALVEGIRFPLEECAQTVSSDFKRTERGYITMQKNSSTDSTNILITSFLTAVECWELIHGHQGLTKEFKNLCKNTQLESWPIFKEFYVNLLIYQGSHHEAIEHLSRLQESSSDIALKNKVSLQMASCLNFTGSFQNSLEILFNVVKKMKPLSSYVYKPLLPKCSARYIYFMGCNNNNEILQYCITMLLQLYKCKKGIDDTFKDMALGFMLILIQYNVDREMDLLYKCIDEIKKNKSFCFQKFFNYIIHVDILEEFSYLTTSHGGNVDMDLLHTSTFQVGKQRAVTRGVNKGARDDLKQAFINQMARCYENLDNLFIDFIKEEQHFLLLILTNG